jgi:hypothetical protein
MANMDAHDMHGLHKVMRSWLLSEDPYGLNNRIEPTFGAAAPPAPATAPPAATPPPDPRAGPAGLQAVAREFAPSPYAEAGRNAAYPDVASTQGEQAVARALAPSPSAEAGRAAAYPDVASTQGEAAVDRALNPPTGSGSGFWAPGEAADTASAVGQSAVEGALAKKARRKIASGGGLFAPARTRDPNLPRGEATRARSPGQKEQDDTPTE